jgi:LacI family transcriptional regulator
MAARQVTPTIQDVARHAGVSAATVSRVLNGTARVKASSTERVRLSVEALQYKPNRAARALRVNRTTTIGLLISDIENPFFIGIMRGVEDVAHRNAYSLILCNSDENPQKEQHYVEVLCAEQVAGAIVVPTRERLPVLRLFHDQNIPVITVDRRVAGLSVDAVLVNNETGAREAVAHLIANGYRRVGVITGPLTTTTGRERLAGYRLALRDAGIAPDPALERIGGFTETSGRLLADELLNSGAIDALFVTNNLMTMGALEALYARHLRVPDDIAIVCFDEVPWAGLSSISLTTVMQPVYELGSIAAMRLFQRMHIPGVFTRQEIVLATTLCVRGSSRPRLQANS